MSRKYAVKEKILSQQVVENAKWNLPLLPDCNILPFYKRVNLGVEN